MKYPRNVLVVFAVLDAILFLQLARFIPFVRFTSGNPLWQTALGLPWPVFILSLAASATGLAMGRKWGFVVSYVQFPFRFAYAGFSFGFIACIPGLSISGGAAEPWFVIAAALECGRLVWTILIHRRLFRATASPAVKA